MTYGMSQPLTIAAAYVQVRGLNEKAPEIQMRLGTGMHHCSPSRCALVPRIQVPGKGSRYWAKEKDFTFTDITHATRFDSIKAAQAVRTKASKKYKEAPWFGITEDDIMFIAEVHTDVPVKEVILKK